MRDRNILDFPRGVSGSFIVMANSCCFGALFCTAPLCHCSTRETDLVRCFLHRIAPLSAESNLRLKKMERPKMVLFFIAVSCVTCTAAFQPAGRLAAPLSPASWSTCPPGWKFGHPRNMVAMKSTEKDDFWSQQKELMQEMTGRAEKSLREEQREKFASRRTALVADTAIFTSLIFSLLWLISVNPFVSFSYALGATFGLAYAYGLGKYVETLGGSVDDAGELQGAGIGQARFAFLILLFLFVGRSTKVGWYSFPEISLTHHITIQASFGVKG